MNTAPAAYDLREGAIASSPRGLKGTPSLAAPRVVEIASEREETLGPAVNHSNSRASAIAAQRRRTAKTPEPPRPAPSPERIRGALARQPREAFALTLDERSCTCT